jgi:hypothetical protein
MVSHLGRIQPQKCQRVFVTNKLVLNENGQICSLADHQFDGALNAKIRHFCCRIRCWLSQRQSLAFRKIVWLQMRAPIHRF